MGNGLRESGMRLPVWRDVDVLVVGATTGAVAAAQAARAGGRTALLVSELSYLGEESAGTLNLWPAELDRTDPLVATMYAEDGPWPALPSGVKRALDGALLRDDIPFLFLARPVALLRDDAGRLAGAVLATRTALCAVRCRALVDATRYGAAARLAALPLIPRTDLPTELAWTVISRGAPDGWDDVVELAPPFRQQIDGEAHTFQAFRVHAQRALLDDDPRAMAHAMRGLHTPGNVLVAADIIPDVPAQRLPGAVYDDPARLPDTAFTPAPGLFLLNGLLPCDAARLERSDVQAALGRRVGVLAAQAVAPVGEIAAVQTGGDATGAFRAETAFLRREEGVLELSLPAFPRLGRCDVAVAGGGTGGAPAGIAAARNGARTVVLETQATLGGVGTVGLVAAYWFGNLVGFTAELDAAVSAIEPMFRTDVVARWSPEIKSAVYHKMLRDAGGAAWTHSFAFGVRLAGDRVDGLLVSTPFGCGLLEAGCVVDATGNADISAAAGAPCRVIGAQHAAVQGTGLSPRYTPEVRAQNSDHTFVDETDPEGITHAFAVSRAKFPKAYDVSPLVNSRERRQIIGDLAISPLDILAERTFPDTLFTARSNFDTHGFIIHPVFMVAEPGHEPLQAHVPFRCMLPVGLDGVLVTGLGVSAHRDALPVIRMQGDVQNQGYAAGLAAALSAARGLPLRQLEIRALQRRLVEIGILGPDVPAHEDSFPMPTEAIRAAVREDLTTLMPAAILFAHPVESQPLLLEILRKDADPARRVQAARILGLMGRAEAGPSLADVVRDAAWDDGWHYRGMGQFGRSMSPLDVTILALARTGDPAGAAVITAKARQLDADAPFSHCRAVGLAAALLRDAALTRAVDDLLALPGLAGHAHLDTRDVIARVDDNMTDNTARELALRELYLARGLYLAGDSEGRGRSILETYTRDLRGVFARHARAVLADGMVADLA